jgi:predicted AlkP superfamily pyrophosphatase or phosphodiesterase
MKAMIAGTLRAIHTVLMALILLLLSGCSRHGQPGVSAVEQGETVILVSLDGFRWDYLDRGETPHLDRIAREGVRADALIPVFPTKTFPNHYSVVTGLYPSNHGIISNSMYDPAIGMSFSLSNREAMLDPRWWGGEPIWATAERHGLISATYFWPGSEVEIGGVRPSHWHAYDGRVPNEDRIDQVLDWLSLPPAQRPRFITIYFSEVDSRGHRFGPYAPETAEAIRNADKLMGRLMDGLGEMELLDSVNLIITSDHGMAATSPDRVIFLDDYLELRSVHVVDMSPVAMIRPGTAGASEVIDILSGAHPNLTVYHREDIPDRLRFGGHPRIPEVLAFADEGWSISTRERFDRNPRAFLGGAHGYDNRYESMRGIFLARGPAIRVSETVPAFESVHIYPLMAQILGVPAAPNDGDPEVARQILR